MIERDLNFEGIDNFRDYGGYQAAGGRLRMGRLYRSAHHGAATDKDLELLSKLGVAALFDMRGAEERAFAPSRRPANFTYNVMECDLALGGGVPAALVASLREAKTEAEALRLYAESYKSLAVLPGIVAAYRAMFSALVDGDGASIIHCNAGKDRTGIGAALVHHALGVHPDDIMADYMLTNTVRGAEQRIALNSFKLRAALGADVPDEVATAYSIVTPEYLDAAFAAIKARSGGIEAYLRDDLGADARWRAKAERVLLA
ncbi:MAG: tyrosine-protein phosphatase [Caulobacterales bacterium]